VAAHSLNPAVNIVRYLHADQSHRQPGGWKLHYIEGVSRSRGERASESEGGQGKAMPGLAHFSPPCIYIRTNDRTNERASERARAVAIYHFVIIDSLYAVALHFLSVCPVKRRPLRFDSVKPLAGFRPPPPPPHFPSSPIACAISAYHPRMTATIIGNVPARKITPGYATGKNSRSVPLRDKQDRGSNFPLSGDGCELMAH